MPAPLSARSEATTRRTYNRPLDDAGSKFETWEQTIERAHVLHHTGLLRGAGGDPGTPEFQDELCELRDLGLSRAGLVAGRTLWLGGTEYGVGRAASNFNCSGLEIASVYDMVDAFWLLLNGCGVGGLPRPGTLHGYNRPVPKLTVVPSGMGRDDRGHKENREERPDKENGYRWTIVVGDSAEAWAKCLGKMLASPRGRCDELVLDFRQVRGSGGRLRGYGWICNGYKPLAAALRAVHAILNRAAGNLLDEIDIGDIFNWCGDVLSNRRAAENLLMDDYNPRVKEFAVRKDKYWEGNPQRRQSNDSILFWRKPPKSTIEELLEENYRRGDPVFVNAEACLRRCPWFRTLNPCLTGDTLVAVADGRNAVTIAELAEESGGVNRFDVYSARPALGGGKGKWVTEISSAVAIMTGVKSVGVLTLSTGDKVRLTADHRVALADGTYCEAADCVGKIVEPFFTKGNHSRRRLVNTESNAHAKQCRMIWERANGKKPAGYEIDHIESDGGDYLSNLQLLTTEDHRAKTSTERQGADNPMHRIRDKERFRRTKSAQYSGAGNPRFSGLTDEYLIELATVLHRDGIPVTLTNMRALDPKVPSSLSKGRFGGSIKNLQKIVRGEAEYAPPVRPEIPDPTPDPEPARQQVTALSFEPQGEEAVYDLIVEKNRNFYVITSGDEADNYLDCRGLLVHNCFEIILANRSFCNLVSVCLPDFHRNFRALERAAYVVARANYRQTCVNLEDGVLQPTWHQTNESLRLCGVSVTGVVQAEWLTDYQIQRLKNSATRGAYDQADELGLPRPKAVCTLKPEGTRSKISGRVGREVNEGMHRALGRHIFNWINFSSEDPLVAGLEAAGYKVIPNPSDRMNVLVRFPVDYSGTRFDTVGGKEVNREPALAQLRRYRRWNNLWCDYNVSATINFDREEIPGIADWIDRHWDDGYVATAFLARTDATKTAADLGHPYLPQEVVTEDDFLEAESGHRPVDWSRFHHGWHDIGDGADCSKGGCPVK